MKAMLIAKKIFTHRYLAVILRIYLGGLFIYASMYKINYPGEFAQIIADYQIAPYWAVNISAVVLPWIELICGILLVIGIRTRSAAVTLVFLLLVFASAIFINLLRGAPIICGCFHDASEKISWWTLARDLIWIIMALHVFFFDKAFHLERRFSVTFKEV